MDLTLKASEAVKAAEEALAKITNPIAIYLNKRIPEVFVLGISNVGRIPGGEISFKKLEHCPDYPWEAYKEVEGVRYFCMLTQGQYEEAVKKSA